MLKKLATLVLIPLLLFTFNGSASLCVSVDNADNPVQSTILEIIQATESTIQVEVPIPKEPPAPKVVPAPKEDKKEAPKEDKPVDYKQELKKLGYYKSDSAKDDLNLRNAIIRFQSDHNIAVDGVWSDHCLAVLKARLKASSFTYPDTVKTPPVNGKWLVLNKSKRILTFYENKKVIKKYPVAIGNPPSLTPDGKFTIVNKIVNPDWGGGGYTKPVPGGSPYNPLGYRWMGLSYKGGSRYGIHGNSSPYSIGTNASHGCIRMINSDVEELFGKVPLSANVWIGTEEYLKKWGISQNEYAG